MLCNELVGLFGPVDVVLVEVPEQPLDVFVEQLLVTSTFARLSVQSAVILCVEILSTALPTRSIPQQTDPAIHASAAVVNIFAEADAAFEAQRAPGVDIE